MSHFLRVGTLVCLKTATTFSVLESDLWSLKISSLLSVCEPEYLWPYWLLSQTRKELQVRRQDSEKQEKEVKRQ